MELKKEIIKILQDSIKVQQTAGEITTLLYFDEVATKISNLVEAPVMPKIVEVIKERCEVEIKWADECLKDMADGTYYHEDDKIFLPTHKKAFGTILEIINSNFTA